MLRVAGFLSSFFWCPRSDSNRHFFRNLILSQARLPVSPLGHIVLLFVFYRISFVDCNCFLLDLAGAVGIEPTHDGIKTRCLTAWRRPNKFLNLLHLSIKKAPCGRLGDELSVHFTQARQEQSMMIAMIGKLVVKRKGSWLSPCLV